MYLVKMRSNQSRVGPQSHRTGALLKGKFGHRSAHREDACEDWGYATTSKGSTRRSGRGLGQTLPQTGRGGMAMPSF